MKYEVLKLKNFASSESYCRDGSSAKTTTAGDALSCNNVGGDLLALGAAQKACYPNGNANTAGQTKVWVFCEPGTTIVEGCLPAGAVPGTVQGFAKACEVGGGDV